MLTITTARFGDIEVEAASVITIDGGILGFAENERFVFLEQGEGSLFNWLQSADDPSLAFVVMDPFDVFTNYEPEISDPDLEALQLTDPQDIVLMTILTVPADPKMITTNLLAPIVVNAQKRRGRQIILANSPYRTKHKLFSEPKAGAE